MASVLSWPPLTVGTTAGQEEPSSSSSAGVAGGTPAGEDPWDCGALSLEGGRYAGVAQSPGPPVPQVRMPTGAPTVWPPPPPPPPCHAPPPPGAAGASPGEDGFDIPPSVQSLLVVVNERVTPMLMAATRASESQVSIEIRRLELAFTALNAKVSKVEALLGMHNRGTHDARKDSLNQAFVEVEQRWEQEIKAVKRELHQTILAHNHNADLMADHKTAIDKIQTEIGNRGPALRPETEVQLQEQLQRLSHTLEHSRGQEQDIDALLRRGEVLLQQFGALGVVPPLAMAAPPQSMPPYVPSSPYHPGMAPMVL